MPTYLWSGKTPDGREEVERIEADTPEAARAELAARGWTELRQHTSEIEEYFGRQTQAESNPEFDVPLTAQESLAYHQGDYPGFWGQWWESAKESLPTKLAMLGLAIFGFYKERYVLGIGFTLAFLVFLFLFPVIHWWFSRTMVLFRKLHTARNWRRWDDVFRLVDQVEAAGKAIKIAVPEVARAHYRALAKAGKGDVASAVADFTEAARSHQMPEWLMHAQIHSIYNVAGCYEEALQEHRLAEQVATDKSIVWIDLANYLVNRFNQPVEARKYLALAEGAQLTELARGYLPTVRGSIAYRENDFVALEKHMREAIAGMLKKPKNLYYTIEPIILQSQGYLAVSLAAQGKYAEAKPLFEAAAAYLKVVRMDHLVAHYDALVAKK